MKSDAAAPVKTVDPGHKLLCWHSQKKKRYLNSPARHFTDIMATISKQNFAHWSLWKPESISVIRNKLQQRLKVVRFESLYIEKYPTISSSQVNRNLPVGLSHDATDALWLAGSSQRNGAMMPSRACGRFGNWLSFTLTLPR